jgi:hypothetical protein
MKDKLLNLEDIKVGMQVNTRQLLNIYDTYVLVGNQHMEENGPFTGEIVCISDKQTQEMKDIVDSCKKQYGMKPFIFAQNSTYMMQ